MTKWVIIFERPIILHDSGPFLPPPSPNTPSPQIPRRRRRGQEAQAFLGSEMSCISSRRPQTKCLAWTIHGAQLILLSSTVGVQDGSRGVKSEGDTRPWHPARCIRAPPIDPGIDADAAPDPGPLKIMEANQPIRTLVVSHPKPYRVIDLSSQARPRSSRLNHLPLRSKSYAQSNRARTTPQSQFPSSP